jgi:hypothetical protein
MKREAGKLTRKMSKDKQNHERRADKQRNYH